MPISPDSLIACIDTIYKDFVTYDVAVDVVSCFESFFNNEDYKNHLIYFDRFPLIPPTELTPDFTVLFDNYGLIFELKQTFPLNDKAFEKEIRQLEKYDSDLYFKSNEQGGKVKPEIQDIVLVLDSQDSNKIFKRLNQKVTDSKFKFKKNLIYLDYSFRSDTGCYSFRKFAGDNKIFRDDSLPISLEKTLGQDSDSLVITPEQFMDHKTIKVLCNDSPPSLYMAVFLWSKILHYYLDADQLIQYRRGNSKKTQEMIINREDLKNDLNKKYIPNGNVHRGWINDTMSFLEKADLASTNSDKTVTIHYRNFQKSSILKRQLKYKGAAEHAEILDLGNLIAQQYCKNIIKITDKKQKPKSGPIRPRQRSLFDF